MKGSGDDPKALMREAYLIAGIGAAECRSIFLDWALALPVGRDVTAAVQAVLAEQGAAAPDHPMTAVLRAALDPAAPPRRRGGRAARLA